MGTKTMTLLLMAWIDFVQEVHSSTSSDTAVRALWHFQNWYFGILLKHNIWVLLNKIDIKTYLHTGSYVELNCTNHQI